MSGKHKDWRLRLLHIRREISHIKTFTQPFDDPASFYEDKMAYLATERSLEIIAEAAKHIPADVRTAYDQIPWASIIGTRNIIAHNYEDVDEDIIWNVCREPLTHLSQVIDKIIKQYGVPET